ncbi:hypothetical protein GE107_05570 [Cohnella sp. CFH 77786]|uniref:hypothetical protein n=1 Tax=Cohnella sp. CFH 77786 TaxID=2662265 RepID=UPI001C610AF1|nr:hypothetical protein [Cohnella sp. CFH 77786]MBW5445531.1 hypothetical protein [Cohnella sp. CFH 77786]
MSAYEEYAQEVREVNALLASGFMIVGVTEGLEGMDVRFQGRPPSSRTAELRLLTADARKYVSALIFESLRAGSPSV